VDKWIGGWMAAQSIHPAIHPSARLYFNRG
jgi:hypothetical protein